MSFAQKRELKEELLREYPHLLMFEQEVDLMIELYDQDKGYIKRMMKSCVAPPRPPAAPPAVTLTDVQVVKPDDAGYALLLDKFAAASEGAGRFLPPPCP
jgi:hypothetical protein